MLFRLRKYLSVFALLLFLFPVVTEEIHNWEHGGDFHCAELSSHHFHLPVHHCLICDFVPAVSDSPVHSFQKIAVVNIPAYARLHIFIFRFERLLLFPECLFI